MPFLQINSLTVGYGQTAVINGFSYDLPEPTFILICGNNGAGKSSLFRALTGLMPFAGKVNLKGHELNATNAAQFIAALGQENPVYFDLTVADLLKLGAIGHGINEPELFDSTQLLTEFQIKHLKNRSLFELSGGERQLAWLAHTKAQNKPVYLLDEPTQHLDIYQRKRMLNYWAQVPENFGKAVLCITHDLPFLDYLPQNGLIWLVDAGSITSLKLNRENLEIAVSKLATHTA